MSVSSVIIGENAKRAREYIGYSQASVADFLNVDQSLISKFEKGDRSLRSDMLERLATLYGYNLADIELASDSSKRRLKTAYRTSGLNSGDMDVIHDINRIALNLFFMTSLTGGVRNEK